jgi:hypothetical protein
MSDSTKLAPKPDPWARWSMPELGVDVCARCGAALVRATGYCPICQKGPSFEWLEGKPARERAERDIQRCIRAMGLDDQDINEWQLELRVFKPYRAGVLGDYWDLLKAVEMQMRRGPDWEQI